MNWMFDQLPNVACIAGRDVMAGSPVLEVAHFEDDHSWAFNGAGRNDAAQAMVVAMSEVLELHAELHCLADLAPGWTATRPAVGEAWQRRQESA
jgi:hypothetical protein